MNGWRVVVVVLVVIMLISIVVEVVATVVAVEWWTKGWTSLSTRRRAHAVVVTLRVMMIIMMIVVLVVLAALLRYKRIRRSGLDKIYHNTSTTVGRRGQVYSTDSLHNELITATATRRIEIRRGTGPTPVVVVQHADGAILPDPVRDLLRVDPDRQLQREHLPQGNRV